MATRTVLSLLLGAVVTLAATAGMAQTRLSVHAEAAQGFAAPGNNVPANLLVVVTDSQTGFAVTNLVRANFMVINHFDMPGQSCGFSNNIVVFNNVGTGAYHLQLGLHHTDENVVCEWVRGDYLAQIGVTSAQGLGQTAVKLTVKKPEAGSSDHGKRDSVKDRDSDRGRDSHWKGRDSH